jgi:hypothetical protein
MKAPLTKKRTFILKELTGTNEKGINEVKIKIKERATRSSFGAASFKFKKCLEKRPKKIPIVLIKKMRP